MDRIEINPEICGGKPVIKGTRIMVKNILGMFSGGYAQERILQMYPEISAEDIHAAVEYAVQVVDEEKVILRSR